MASDGAFTIRVKGQDGDPVHFLVKSNTKLAKVMNAYCENKQLDVTDFVFLVDDRRIKVEDTTEDFGLKEGSEISAMLHLTGGGAYWEGARTHPNAMLHMLD